MKNMLNKIGDTALWCAYLGCDVVIIAGASVFAIFNIIKSKVRGA